MKLRLFAVAALALATMASPAMAHSHHHAFKRSTHRHRRYSHRRHFSDRPIQPQKPVQLGFGVPELVRVAASDLGNTAARLGVRTSLWCMAAVNHWLREVGLPGSGSDAALSALKLGPHTHRPVVGALAVMARRGGGHVGVVSGVTPDGNPIIISGNHGHHVAQSVYPARRIIAYVIPQHRGS